MIITMDPHNRRVSVDDRSTELEGWLKSMRNLGVDVDVEFKTELARLANAGALFGHLNALKAGAGLGRPQVIARLAKDAGTFEDTMAMLTILTSGQTREQLDAQTGILRRASDRALTLACDAFAHHGDKLLELIRPVHKRIVEAIAASYAGIPDGVLSLEAAARKGCGESWLALEKACRQLDSVRDLMAGWYRDGVLPHRGGRKLTEYSIGQLMYGEYDRTVAIHVDARGPGPGLGSGEPAILLTAKCVAQAKPCLRTTAQADAGAKTAA